jgi:hypothetical protein
MTTAARSASSERSAPVRGRLEAVVVVAGVVVVVGVVACVVVGVVACVVVVGVGDPGKATGGVGESCGAAAAPDGAITATASDAAAVLSTSAVGRERSIGRGDCRESDRAATMAYEGFATVTGG